MSPRELAQRLRHDLKYASLTVQNLEEGPLEPWAARAIWRDLYETRRGASCLALCEEAARALCGSPLEEAAREVVEAARALEGFRAPLEEGRAELTAISTRVGALRRAVEALCRAADEAS